MHDMHDMHDKHVDADGRSPRAVVLVDGEHYPPVTAAAVEAVRGRGYEVVAAVFCGGGEKLSKPLDLGDTPLVRAATAWEALEAALAEHRPDLVADLSDDPVVDHVTRMRLAALALARGAAYEAPGLRMTPPALIAAPVPTLAVIGTGKRCGKTAVSAHAARVLAANGIRPVVIAMGRGGPEKPAVVRGDLAPPSPADLIRVAAAGDHAASDVYEDAVVAGVAAVGARRAGAGPAGQTAVDTVAEAIEAALGLRPDLMILEGSGSAVPSVAADQTILVARWSDDLGEWPGLHRLLLADLLVVRMPAEVDPTEDSTLTSPNRDQASSVVRVAVTFQPFPLGPVEGRRVYAATTAPEAAGPALRRHLEALGANVVGVSHHLADRTRLVEDLGAAAGSYEILACELKAAAVDVAVRAAVEDGAEVVFLDNRPLAVEGDLDAEILNVARRALERR